MIDVVMGNFKKLMMHTFLENIQTGEWRENI